MQVIIDRIEGEYAVVELGEKTYDVPLALFPGAREGDSAEITVLGKMPREDEESPHAIFERLRKKSRRKNKAERPPVKATAATSADDEKTAAGIGDPQPENHS